MNGWSRKEKELMGTDNSVVIAGWGVGWVEVEEGVRGTMVMDKKYHKINYFRKTWTKLKKYSKYQSLKKCND